jgi:hypothetical protein
MTRRKKSSKSKTETTEAPEANAPKKDAAMQLMGGLSELGQGSGRTTGANTGAGGSKGAADYLEQGINIYHLLAGDQPSAASTTAPKEKKKKTFSA